MTFHKSEQQQTKCDAQFSEQQQTKCDAQFNALNNIQMAYQ